jgi:hypothetical protein
MVRMIALGLGVLIVLASAATIAVPELRLSFERSLMTPSGLDWIALLRIAVGLIFVLAASASHAPRTLRVFGVVVIVAGLATPWFGADRATSVIDWASRSGPMVVRLDAALGMALGVFLVYVLRRPAATL